MPIIYWLPALIGVIILLLYFVFIKLEKIRKITKKEKRDPKYFLSKRRFKKIGKVFARLKKPYSYKSGIVLESGKKAFLKKQIVPFKKKYIHKNRWCARIINCSSAIVIAAPGTGKTQSTMLPTIIFNAQAKDFPNMIITDPKPELHALTNWWLRENGYNVITLDFSRFDYSLEWNYSHSYNPLDELSKLHKLSLENDTYKYSLNEAINNIVKKIIYMKNKSNLSTDNDYFSDNAQTIISWSIAFFYFLIENPNIIEFTKKEIINDLSYKNVTLPNIYTFVAKINAEEITYKLKELIKDEKIKKQNPIWLNFSEWINTDIKQLNSFLTTAKSILGVFNSNLAKQVLSSSSFLIDDILKKDSKTIIFLNLPLVKGEQLSLITFLLNNLISNIIVKSLYFPEGKLPNPWYFLIDEAGTLGTIEDFSAVLNTGRSKNMFILTIFQNTDQIKSKYSDSGLLKSNPIQILYSNNENDMALQISRMSGSKRNEAGLITTQMTPYDVNSLPKNRSLIYALVDKLPYFAINIPFWKFEKNFTKSEIFKKQLIIEPLLNIDLNETINNALKLHKNSENKNNQNKISIENKNNKNKIAIKNKNNQNSEKNKKINNQNIINEKELKRKIYFKKLNILKNTLNKQIKDLSETPMELAKQQYYSNLVGEFFQNNKNREILHNIADFGKNNNLNTYDIEHFIKIL